MNIFKTAFSTMPKKHFLWKILLIILYCTVKHVHIGKGPNVKGQSSEVKLGCVEPGITLVQIMVMYALHDI